MLVSRREPIWRRYVSLVRPDTDAVIEAELRFRFDERTTQLVSRGAGLEEAQAQAMEEFGGLSVVRAELRAIDRRMAKRRSRLEALTAVADDLRQA